MQAMLEEAYGVIRAQPYMDLTGWYILLAVAAVYIGIRLILRRFRERLGRIDTGIRSREVRARNQILRTAASLMRKAVNNKNKGENNEKIE